MSVLLSPYNLPASEDVKYIDPACSPGTHDGSWAEEYGGRTDYKPYGGQLPRNYS